MIGARERHFRDQRQNRSIPFRDHALEFDFSLRKFRHPRDVAPSAVRPLSDLLAANFRLYLRAWLLRARRTGLNSGFFSNVA